VRTQTEQVLLDSLEEGYPGHKGEDGCTLQAIEKLFGEKDCVPGGRKAGVCDSSCSG